MTAPRLPDYVEHIQLAAQEATDFVAGMDFEQFLRDKRTQRAAMMCILIMGEASTKIMELHSDFALSHRNIPWQSMRNTRNRLMHGYFDLSLQIVWGHGTRRPTEAVVRSCRPRGRGVTANEVKKLLGLVRHPREGGWYVRTWESAELVELKRYGGVRRTSTAIYYLLEPDTFSEMHVLESDEIFHHYLGGAVEMLQLFEDGSTERVVIGKDIEAGETLQHVVQRGVWQGSRLKGAEGWALLGCTVVPGFEFEDYKDASADELAAKWPGEARMIRELTRR